MKISRQGGHQWEDMKSIYTRWSQWADMKSNLTSWTPVGIHEEYLDTLDTIVRKAFRLNMCKEEMFFS